MSQKTQESGNKGLILSSYVNYGAQTQVASPSDRHLYLLSQGWPALLPTCRKLVLRRTFLNLTSDSSNPCLKTTIGTEKHLCRFVYGSSLASVSSRLVQAPLVSRREQRNLEIKSSASLPGVFRELRMNVTIGSF